MEYNYMDDKGGSFTDELFDPACFARINYPGHQIQARLKRGYIKLVILLSGDGHCPDKFPPGKVCDD